MVDVGIFIHVTSGIIGLDWARTINNYQIDIQEKGKVIKNVNNLRCMNFNVGIFYTLSILVLTKQ